MYVTDEQSVNESKDSNLANLTQQCRELELQFYHELAEAEAKDDMKAVYNVLRRYNMRFDKIANSFLKEEPIQFIELEAKLPTIELPDGAINLDDELLDYVLYNTDELRKTQLNGVPLIRDFEHDAFCLICDRKINGLGLMDTLDAGVNAVCFNCIDKEHHYLGGGLYFTNFI